jgi:hypothetical protein
LRRASTVTEAATLRCARPKESAFQVEADIRTLHRPMSTLSRLSASKSEWNALSILS